MVRAFGMNKEVGDSSPPQVGTSSVPATPPPKKNKTKNKEKRLHFHKNTRSCVENEYYLPHTINNSNFNVDITSNIITIEIMACVTNYFP